MPSDSRAAGYRKPGARPGNGLEANDTGHDSCWECSFMRVVPRFYDAKPTPGTGNRQVGGSMCRCVVSDDAPALFYVDVRDEVRNEGKTVADDCQWFHFDKSLGELTEDDLVLERSAKVEYAKDKLEQLSLSCSKIKIVKP